MNADEILKKLRQRKYSNDDAPHYSALAYKPKGDYTKGIETDDWKAFGAVVSTMVNDPGIVRIDFEIAARKYVSATARREKKGWELEFDEDEESE